MSARVFFDTNVLVYAVDPTDSRNRKIARDLLAHAEQTRTGVISFQVVQEWFNVVFRKAAVRLTAEDAEFVYRTAVEPLWHVDSSRALIDNALALFRDHSFSWWDALIVSAAMEAKCSILLSEDLQHGREIGGLRIENPFL